MSAPALEGLPERLAVRPAGRRRDWRGAWDALQQLLRRPDSTGYALRVIYALDGDMSSTRLDRLLLHPEGRRLYFERPSLLEVLADRERLAAMPEGSFGRAYLAHLERHGFDPAAISQLRKDSDPVRERGEGDAWFAERADLMHDLWHVLTGYGADRAGESAALIFSHGPTRGVSYLLLGLGTGFQMMRKLRRLDWPGYLLRAWWRGWRTVPLDLLPYEALLPLPLDAVREAVGLGAPERAHRGGVIVSQDRPRRKRRRDRRGDAPS